jgi:signal transduction histidine kinase
MEGMQVKLCIMKDVSAEKRRRVLERVFFHDVMNTVSGIYQVAETLAEGGKVSPEERKLYGQWLVQLSERLVDEIKHQQKLLDAETGELKLELGAVCIRQIMEDVLALYSNHTVAKDRALLLEHAPDRVILSDAAILRRILGNLVKNALEATEPGGTVTMRCSDTDDEVVFSVRNPGIMPEGVQLQLFQRSFSTKGKGRGIGTYSVKLFGERYLNGRVWFVSRPDEGTTFNFSLPVADRAGS